jgi:ABC-type uncharacterized transport system substrate-binding protein
MNRRGALAVLAALLVAPAGAVAQTNRTPRRIAFLGVFPASRAGPMLAQFREGLIGEGLAEGRDFAIEYAGEPRIDRLPARISDLLRQQPELLVAMTTPAAQAATRATQYIPIVFGTVSDPVGSGLVASLARPGGNVTGVSNMLPELSGKLLELAREMLPDVARVAVLWNPDNPAKVLEIAKLRLAAGKFGVELTELRVRSLRDLERALAPGQTDLAKLLLILADTLTDQHRERIAELARASRVVVVSTWAGHTQSGGVLSYSPDYAALNRRLGGLAGRILKGAKPSELPVELPTTFKLVVNRGAAKTLDLVVPQSILIRADQVIE